MPGLERLDMDLKTICILLRKVRSHPSWVLLCTVNEFDREKHLLDEENDKLMKMYCESFILTSNVFVILCHIFEVLLIKWKPKNITLTNEIL